uniref:Uncharacterized protein n=1 Tax=Jahnella sp. MSr9139 TaxID=1434086 RepID=A0A3S7UW12_9BACT|nr:hypothetical protein [Jahnella sp. MSr9139]
MNRLLIGSFAFAAALSAAAVAQAHINMLNPTPRHDSATGDQKAGPCGVAGSTRGSVIATFQPGEAITIEWDETIDHTGHYRVLFAEDGQDFPNPANGADVCTPGTELAPGIHCLADNIPDQAGGPNYTQPITLPNISCNNCTLQLIQWMSDKEDDGIPNNEIYFECVDVTLGDGSSGQGGGSSSSSSGTGGGGQGGSPTTSSSSSSSSSGNGGSGANPDAPLAQPEDSTCSYRAGSVSGGLTPAAAVAALGLLAFAARRRRSGR